MKNFYYCLEMKYRKSFLKIENRVCKRRFGSKKLGFYIKIYKI